MRTAVIVTGGPAPGPVSSGAPVPIAPAVFDRELAEPALVVAVDGGLGRVGAMGLHADLVIGDMDSVDDGDLDQARLAGARVVRHPVDKDATDLELALDEVMAAGIQRILVIGSDGGRMDHLLAGLLVLGSGRFAAIEIDARLGGSRVVIVHERRTIEGRPGALVSLLPLGGPAVGVHTEGLAWPLDGETLAVGSTRGVSNRFEGSEATVSLGSGCLAVVVPEPER